MKFDDLRSLIEDFDGVKLIRVNHGIDSRGVAAIGELELIMRDKHNLPESLLGLATGLKQEVQSTPIYTMQDPYEPVEMVRSNVYTVTFRYDHMFIHFLKLAHEKEEYKKQNKEADEFIERWLAQ